MPRLEQNVLFKTGRTVSIRTFDLSEEFSYNMAGNYLFSYFSGKILISLIRR